MELADIQKNVSDAARKGSLATLIRDVLVEPDKDEFDDEFLRVEIKLGRTEKDIDSELEAVIERVEEAVAAVDDRYPSVRFLDAA